MKELDVKQENERKKEYLDGYRKCVRQLDRLNEELSEIRINKMFPSLIQDGMPLIPLLTFLDMLQELTKSRERL